MRSARVRSFVSCLSFASAVGLLGVARPAIATEPVGSPTAPADPGPVVAAIEPKALELLKAMSARLAAANTLSFTALTTYESPSRLGPPLAYTTLSQVSVQRPNRFRVLTTGDGPATEVYDDGKTLVAFAPAENLAAVAAAPPTLDGALRLLHESAAFYLPFTDVLVADPYGDIADGIEVAFVVGQSQIVDGTTTNIVAFAAGRSFQQVWIGADDQLPRRIRAVYGDDPSRLRHDLELSSWKLDGEIPEGAFTSAKAAAATRIPFERPDPKPPGGIPGASVEPAAKNSQSGGRP
ncbi:MAG: DUF2092 domain-containing protein [Deltaproteobacteria bacterium]|nr:DUF2092 domain-containing protein [Deltaproteobacteria bacterium]